MSVKATTSGGYTGKVMKSRERSREVTLTIEPRKIGNTELEKEWIN